MNHWLIAPLLVPLTASVALLFATGGSPAISRAGYVATDASPAMLPVRPPATPAASRSNACCQLIAANPTTSRFVHENPR